MRSFHSAALRPDAGKDVRACQVTHAVVYYLPPAQRIQLIEAAKCRNAGVGFKESSSWRSTVSPPRVRPPVEMTCCDCCDLACCAASQSCSPSWKRPLRLLRLRPPLPQTGLQGWRIDEPCPNVSPLHRPERHAPHSFDTAEGLTVARDIEREVRHADDHVVRDWPEASSMSQICSSRECVSTAASGCWMRHAPQQAANHRASLGVLPAAPAVGLVPWLSSEVLPPSSPVSPSERALLSSSDAEPLAGWLAG